MKLYINEKTCSVETYEKEKNLKEIISSIEKNSLPNAHVITTVKLNGVILSLEEEKEIAERYPYERIESLEILSASPKQLMLEGIEAAPIVLQELRENTTLVVEKIRQGEVDQAMQVFQKSLESMLWFNEMLSLIGQLASIDYSQVRWERGDLGELNIQLLNVYNEIIKNQQNRDWINLSDVLEYEFIPLINQWIEVLPVFLTYLKTKLEEIN